MDREAEYVTVTHYINPHCFWYKPNVAYTPEQQQCLFSSKLNDKCVALYGARFFGEQKVAGRCVADVPENVVAVYNTMDERWNRCVVDEVINCLGGKRMYRLWALDEGIPIQSSAEFIRPLPAEFKDEPAHAKRGSLMNIFPFETSNRLMRNAPGGITNKWYAGAVSVMETFLEMASLVSMVEKVEFPLDGEIIHFGDMTVELDTNEVCDVAQFLYEKCPNQVTQCLPSMFFKDILQLKTLRVSRYHTNGGIDSALKQTAWMKTYSKHKAVLQVDVLRGSFGNGMKTSPITSDIAGNLKTSPILYDVRKPDNEIKQGQTTMPKPTQTNIAPAGDAKICSTMKRMEISQMDTKISPATAQQGTQNKKPPIRRVNIFPAGFPIAKALDSIRKESMKASKQ
ncbi:uncharacterized protein LOC131213684 [Anopheles bellator]|uniref:uncharacterized protein LOC131213684 n=1 Tax=Anopheles bellator TaxID=139047 RepID=UPI002647BE40|nr:uncharacterized protein LOC131213684 [Anopheles bellator]